ncbi:hypothetical protein BN961_00217 [Afipia felis]|uniref:Uncharacterized protein n=1 Tax=Afipia felis TaxID=1035 RepID=A0A090MGV0_AFIFE|nr:hypothetical protein BN961_00217 [Afipia felis]
MGDLTADVMNRHGQLFGGRGNALDVGKRRVRRADRRHDLIVGPIRNFRHLLGGMVHLLGGHRERIERAADLLFESGDMGFHGALPRELAGILRAVLALDALFVLGVLLEGRECRRQGSNFIGAGGEGHLHAKVICRDALHGVTDFVKRADHDFIDHRDAGAGEDDRHQ